MTHPTDVVRAALATPIPCPVCGRTTTCRCMPHNKERRQWRAEHIVAALVAAGHLPEPASAAQPAMREEPVVDVEGAAQFLAHESRHPRFGGELWAALLDSSAYVEVAYRAAQQHVKDPEGLRALADARGVLLTHIEQGAR